MNFSSLVNSFYFSEDISCAEFSALYLPILGQINSMHNIVFYVFAIHHDIILSSSFIYPKCSLCLG